MQSLFSWTLYGPLIYCLAVAYFDRVLMPPNGFHWASPTPFVMKSFPFFFVKARQMMGF
jgi:hypothetical protein